MHVILVLTMSLLLYNVVPLCDVCTLVAKTPYNKIRAHLCEYLLFI